MAKHTARMIGIFLLIIPVLSCFEIKEIIKFNKDGSGSFSFQVGIQEQFRAFMAMTRKMQEEKKRKQAEAEEKDGEEAGKTEESEMDSEMAEMEREENQKAPDKEFSDFDESRKKISKIPGISNVRGVRDEKNFRFGINFDFADIEALNRALHGLQKNPGKEVAYFTLTRGALERRPIVGFQEALKKKMQKGKDGQAKPDFNPALLGIKFLYITEYTFAREVRRVSNPRAQVLADKHTVRMEHSMFDPDQQETNVGNKVEFKRWYHVCLPFL